MYEADAPARPIPVSQAIAVLSKAETDASAVPRNVYGRYTTRSDTVYFVQ
jgi:hypothetical protein